MADLSLNWNLQQGNPSIQTVYWESCRLSVDFQSVLHSYTRL